MLDHQDLLAVRGAANRAVQAVMGANTSVEVVEHWGGGAHNSGYRLRLADGRQFFMKIEKEKIFPRTRRCQIEREVYGLRLAAAAGLEVPEIIGYDFTREFAGCRYLLEEFIDQELLGEALERLPEEQRGPLLAAYERVTAAIYAIHDPSGGAFGDLFPGGWLGRYGSWREAVGAFSTILLEDMAVVGRYSAQEQRLIADAHAIAVDAIFYEGPAILTHNDLHPWNVFYQPGANGEPGRVGKLFDFGLSLFQAKYLSAFGPRGFDGNEVEVARRFHVSEAELCGYSIVSGLEFVNFASEIRFAPDQPYGWVERSKAYLQMCEEYVEAGK